MKALIQSIDESKSVPLKVLRALSSGVFGNAKSSILYWADGGVYKITSSGEVSFDKKKIGKVDSRDDLLLALSSGRGGSYKVGSKTVKFGASSKK